MTGTAIRTLLLIACFLVASRHAAAQCEGRWLEGPEFVRSGLGSNVHVRAMVMWDSDGPGPTPERMVIGGTVNSLDGPGFVAMWDGEKFAMLPPYAFYSTFDRHVRALAVYNGELIVACRYGTYHTPQQSMFAWNGTSWRVIATGSNPQVFSLTVAHGRLYAIGALNFTGASGDSRYVARWDGQSWQGVSEEWMTTNPIVAITAANGDVIVGANAWGVRRFNGTSWSILAESVDSRVRSLLELPDGSIVAGGLFTEIDGVPANNIARYNGNGWQPMGVGSTAPVRALAYDQGRVIAVMDRSLVNGRYAYHLGGWTANAGWTPIVGPLVGAVDESSSEDYGPYAMLAHDGRLHVGGGFDTAGPYSAQRFATLEEDAWVQEGSGFNGDVVEFIEYGSDVIAAGRFTIAPGGVPASRVARWDGAAWHAFGSGLDGPVTDAVIADGVLVVSGEFSASGTAPVGRIARWTGTTWAPVGNMDPGVVGPIAAVGSTIYARYGTQIRRWNAATHNWDMLPIILISNAPEIATVHAIHGHDGFLYAGGEYDVYPTNRRNAVLARWTGDAWTIVVNAGSGQTPVPYSVHRMWSLPGHAVAYAGSNIVFGRFVTGVPMPLAQPPFFSAQSFHSLLAMSSDSTGRLIGAGSFRLSSWPTAEGPLPVNNIAFHENGAWNAMRGGRSVTTSILARNRSVFTNAGPVGDDYGIMWSWSHWTHDNIPWVAHQPADAEAQCGQATTIAIVPAAGYGTLSFAWQVEDPAAPDGWRTIDDGPLNVLGDVVGVIADAATPSLSMTPAMNFGPLGFRCVVSNSCGQVTSDAALVRASSCANVCDADVNCDGSLTFTDIEAQERAVGGDAEGYCRPNPDFTRDFALNGLDVEAVALVVGGGPCP